MNEHAIASLVEPLLAVGRLELDRLEIVRAGKRSVLRLYLDGDGPEGRGPSLVEIADATRAIAEQVAAGKLRPGSIDEKTVARFMPERDMPDVDLFVRSSGEQRTSNFLLWQSAYAEYVFLDQLWPDFDRRDLWRACEIYARRDRRYGGAVDKATR